MRHLQTFTSPEVLLAEGIARKHAEAVAQQQRRAQFAEAFRLLLRTVGTAAAEDGNARCLAAIGEVERLLGLPRPSSSTPS